MNHLHLSSFATERDLRLAIIEAGRICYSNGLMHANTGNISMRLGNDRIVITPSKLCKGRLEPEDLLIIDLDGAIIKADTVRKRKFSSEAPLHLEVYRQRPDIRAVIHAHPANATALTVAGIPFPVDVLPEVLEGLGPVPTTRFTMPNSLDDAEAIREYVKEHNAILIRNHGALTFGVDLEQALNHLEQVESVARILVKAHVLGKVNHLPDEIMSAMREKYLNGHS
ncbi:MAG: class II aldolase/adducin family protein [Chloroflexi bacterium]|nr:class II aldolase/adducin family protein [Chloroflexota bacterium]